MAKPKVISVANQKGDVGKSTTVYNLGAGPAMDGMKDLSLSAKTIRGLHAMLRQCLDQAVQERLIPFNPEAGMQADI